MTQWRLCENQPWWVSWSSSLGHNFEAFVMKMRAWLYRKMTEKWSLYCHCFVRTASIALAAEECAAVLREHKKQIKECFVSLKRSSYLQERRLWRLSVTYYTDLETQHYHFCEITRAHWHYKARYVPDGSHEGITLNHVHEKPISMNVRMLVSVAKKWELRSWDIVLVFTLAHVQTFCCFSNLERKVKWIELEQIEKVLWNLYWDVAAP